LWFSSPFLPSSPSPRFLLDLFGASPSTCARLSKLNSPLSILENDSLESLSVFVRFEEKRDRKESKERLSDSVIARLDSPALPPGVGVLSCLRSVKKVPKQLRNRCPNEPDEDVDGDEW
jgi:hypothetical protein